MLVNAHSSVAAQGKSLTLRIAALSAVVVIALVITATRVNALCFDWISLASELDTSPQAELFGIGNSGTYPFTVLNGGAGRLRDVRDGDAIRYEFQFGEQIGSTPLTLTHFDNGASTLTAVQEFTGSTALTISVNGAHVIAAELIQVTVETSSTLTSSATAIVRLNGPSDGADSTVFENWRTGLGDQFELPLSQFDFEGFGDDRLAYFHAEGTLAFNPAVSFDATQTGGTLDICPDGALVVGHPTLIPQLRLTDNAGSSGVEQVILGKSAGHRGRLVVENGSNLTNTGDTTIGEMGEGELAITGAASVFNTTAVLGHAEAARGDVTVSGNASRWHNSGDVIVGGAGSGSLQLANQASVISEAAVIVGQSGLGQVTVAFGAQLKGDLGIIGENNGAEGEVTVRGGAEVLTPNGTVRIPSTWNSTNGLQIGASMGAKARLTIEDSGLVRAEDEIRIGLDVANPSSSHVVHLGGELSNDGSRLESEHAITVAKSGKLTGRGIVSSRELINHGAIEIDPHRLAVHADVLPRDGVTGYQSSLTIDGDFTQSEFGTIRVRGLQAEHRLQPTGDHSTSVLVTGTAVLDGAMEVDFADGYLPSVGDRYALLTADEILGRLSTFDTRIRDAAVNDQYRDDRFMALNYRRDLTGDEPVLEAIVLEAPRRMSDPSSASGRNLVLVTHGTNATADPSEGAPSWVTQLAQEFALRGGADWQAYALDWKHFNGGAPDSFKNLPFDPFISASNGINIGASFVDWYADGEMFNDGAAFDTVHLVSHSSGSWLVDSIADQLAARGVANEIHLTLFDAFTPPVGIRAQDAAGLVLGDAATFTEHYLHRYKVNTGQPHPIPDLVLFTDHSLPNALNIDLSLLGQPLNPIDSHGFPYVWYLDSAGAPDDPMVSIGGFGAAVSKEYSGMFPQLGDGVENGDLIYLQPGGKAVKTQFSINPVSLYEQVNVTDGLVEILPDGTALLETQSPAVLTSFINVDSSFSAISFDFGVFGGGLLSAYFDGQQVFGVDGGMFELDADATIPSGLIWLGEEFEAGQYSLTFRIDPLDDAPVAAKVSNLSFVGLGLSIDSADFNNDGIVDGADLEIWQTGFGSLTAMRADGDANNDGVVDGADFLMWQRNFGQTAGNGAGVGANAAVPEPATLVLMFAAAVLRARRGRAIQFKCQKLMSA